MAARFRCSQLCVEVSGDFLPKQGLRWLLRRAVSLFVSFDCDSLSEELLRWRERNRAKGFSNDISRGLSASPLRHWFLRLLDTCSIPKLVYGRRTKLTGLEQLFHC